MSDSEKAPKILKRPPRLGDVVQVKTTLQEGTVKFIGGIHFKSGTWVGIELFEHGTGKNNGTIKGVTYFKCPSQTGLLVMASSVNVLKPAQKVVTNSQKASLVSKTIYKQPKKPRKSISRPSESTSPTESVDTTRKIKTLPRQNTKQTPIKVKPRPKSTQVTKSSYATGRLDRMNKELRPAQTNININMTMTTSPKEKSIFLKNRISPNTSSIIIPKCEIDGDQIPEDSKNINDAIINGLQNTLVHLKDIVSGLADEYYDENGQPRIKTTIQQNDAEADIDLSISQDGKEPSEGDLENKKESINYSASNIPLNKHCEEGVRMSLKQVTDSQRTISELSIGLVNAQQEVRKLKDNQTNLNHALSYYKEENKSLIERVAELEKQNKSLMALPSKERYIQELETKNKNLNSEYEQVKNELYFAKKNIDELYRKLEYNESVKSVSVYNKYSQRNESRIARHKTFAKGNNSYNTIYKKPRTIRDNGSSEFSYNSDSETKINDTLLDMKEQNEKLILENETLREEMEMLKNTLLDIQDDRENSTNHFMEKMEYQEKKYDDLKMRYLQIEEEKNELINRIESMSNLNDGELPEISKKSNAASMDDAMIDEMKALIADMEVTLNKTILSEKEARSNFDAVNKLYEASKVKMETLKHELEQRKMDYQLLSESNEDLTKENNELKQSIEKLNQAQIQNETLSNEKLQDQYQKLQKQYEATKIIIEDKEAEMINYEVQCNQLEGQIIDFEKQLSMKQNEIDCLIEKYQTLQTANSCRDWNEEEKNEVIQDQANKICMLEDAVKEIKDENNLLKINNEKSINEISKLNKIKNDLEKEVAAKKNEIEKKAQENESKFIENEIKEKNEQIEELTHKNNELSTEIKESNEKFLEIKNEKEKVDQELEELNKRMSKNTQELEDLTVKYEEDKKHYEAEIFEINKDREMSVKHAKEEIETIIGQLSDTRKQFEIKINQLETSKQKMKKEYETEIEDLNQQLQLLANLQQQTEQAENLLELSTLLDESERAKEVAESNAENRRKLLEKVIVERDKLSQDLQSEKEKFISLKGEYEHCKEKMNELKKDELASFIDRNRSFTRDCNNCEKLKQEITKLKEEIEEFNILKNIDVQGIDNALKQSNEDIQKEREEKEMLKKGYTIIWNSYLSLENECQKLLTQLNQKMGIKEGSISPSPTLRKAQSVGSIPSSFPTPKDKMNITFDSIQDYTYDFDYVSVPDSNRLLDRELKEEIINTPSSTKDHDQEQDKHTSIKTVSDSHSPSSIYSPRQEEKKRLLLSTQSESSNNTLYSPKRRSSFNASTKYQNLPKTNPNRIKNYKSQSVIYESLENNDETLYHKPEDEADLIDYSSILQKSRARSSTLLSNNKYSYRN